MGLSFSVPSPLVRLQACHPLTYLRDKFYRLKARRGYKRAAVAIAHKILVSIYHMLSQQVSYNDLGDLTWTSSTAATSRATWFIDWNVWATQSH